MQNLPPPGDGLRKCLHELELPLNATSVDWEMLRVAIASQVGYMLINQRERFFQVLYRLDVNELKVTSVLDHQLPENWAMGIANLIVDREIEREMWRKRYSESEKSGTSD